MPPDEAQILAAIRPIIDPELGISVVDLGLIQDVTVSASGEVDVAFTTTAPACPMVGIIGYGIRQAVAQLAGVTKVRANLVTDPPWNPERMTAEAMDKLYRR